MIKKYYVNDLQKELDYIRIFEIYLNYYYNKIDKKISIFEGEEIEVYRERMDQAFYYWIMV